MYAVLHSLTLQMVWQLQPHTQIFTPAFVTRAGKFTWTSLNCYTYIAKGQLYPQEDPCHVQWHRNWTVAAILNCSTHELSWPKLTPYSPCSNFMHLLHYSSLKGYIVVPSHETMPAHIAFNSDGNGNCWNNHTSLLLWWSTFRSLAHSQYAVFVCLINI